jgi:integrase
MAHVERRGPARWRARYRGPDGRERSQTFETRRDAERFLTQVEHAKLTGTYVDPTAGRVTFRKFAEEWRKLQVHRPGTATSVEQTLRRHVYPRIGDRPIGAVRTSEIQALVKQAAAELAPTTVELLYRRVVSVFRAAVRDRLIPTSPCVDIKLPAKRPDTSTELLTTEQVVALADAVPDRYRAAVLFGAATGLRPGELFGLTVNRVDFLRRSVKVDQQLARVSGQDAAVALGPLKTASSYRAVPLAGAASDVLAAHLSCWPAGGEPALVFTNERGGPVQQHPFAVVWEVGRERAGLPSWATPHDLRHYYASLLIRSGASVKVVQRRLGHASAKTTLDIYGHLWPDDEDRTRAAIDAELGTALEPPAAVPRPGAVG